MYRSDAADADDYGIADDARQLADADALPDDWPITLGRLAVRLLASAAAGVESGAMQAADAKIRESIAATMLRALPDGVRVHTPTDDQAARILAAYETTQDE